MADLAVPKQLHEKFKAAFAKDDLAACKRLLSTLKLELTKLPSLPPVYQQSPNAQQQLLLAREVLELAVLVAIRQDDDPAFERTFAQLRPYYLDAATALPPSPEAPLLWGLHLLLLLVQNRIAEFHTALELAPREVLDAPEVAQVLQLERWLMEGAYNKVLAARPAPASPYFAPLLERLASTVRDEIASCSEAAYASLSAAAAARMLMLGSDADLAQYAAAHGWELVGGRVVFKPEGGHGEKAVPPPPALDIIDHCLTYAKELERIV